MPTTAGTTLSNLESSKRMGMRDLAEDGISCVRVVRVVSRGVIDRLDRPRVRSRCEGEECEDMDVRAVGRLRG